eukprot:4037698-Lingulodinium_polyedra.AAC.1
MAPAQLCTSPVVIASVSGSRRSKPRSRLQRGPRSMAGDILRWNGWFISKAGVPRDGGTARTGGQPFPSQ